MIINDLAVALMATGDEAGAKEMLSLIGQEGLIDTIKKATL